MREILPDPELVAFCGLFCGACNSYLQETCEGCHKNMKATWCKVRQCCLENKILTCAECPTYDDSGKCKKFNNIFSKVIGFFLCADRRGCIEQIRALGLRAHVENMALNKRHSLSP